MVPIVTAYTGTCLANAPHTVAYSLQWIFGVKRCFVNIYGMSLHCQCFITVRGNAVKKKKRVLLLKKAFRKEATSSI